MCQQHNEVRDSPFFTICRIDNRGRLCYHFTRFVIPEDCMEIWDILDGDGQPTGRTIARGEKMGPGEYYLAVHIWIVNSKGEYLIQKRDDEKPLWPGMWAVTGGAAIAGESSLQAALREVEEEIGIHPDAGSMELLARIKRTDWFTDLWLLRQDIAMEDIVMQPGEVSDVLWANRPKIMEMAGAGDFVKYSYLGPFFHCSIAADSIIK